MSDNTKPEMILVPRKLTEAMAEAYASFHHDNRREGHAREDTPAQYAWDDMIEAWEKGENKPGAKSAV